MSQITDKLLNVDKEVLNDPRVQEALQIADIGLDKEASKAVTSNIVKPYDAILAKYGLKMKTTSLRMKTLMARIMFAYPSVLKPKFDSDGKPVLDNKGSPEMESIYTVPSISQGLNCLFVLTALNSEVDKAVTALENEGIEEFTEMVYKFFEDKNVDLVNLPELLNVLAEDTKLLQKLLAANESQKKT